MDHKNWGYTCHDNSASGTVELEFHKDLAEQLVVFRNFDHFNNPENSEKSVEPLKSGDT